MNREFLDFLMFIFRHLIIVNLVVVKRFGVLGILIFLGLGGKCVFVLFIKFCLELGFQLFTK